MTTTTLLPDNPRVGSGTPVSFSVTGGSAALRDGSDSTFMQLNGQWIIADALGGFSLPADEKVTSATITGRVQGAAFDYGYIYFTGDVNTFPSTYVCYQFIQLNAAGIATITSPVNFRAGKPTTADVASYSNPGFGFQSGFGLTWKVIEVSIEFTSAHYVEPVPLPNSEMSGAIPFPMGTFTLDFDAAGVSDAEGHGADDAFYTFTAPSDGYLQVRVDCTGDDDLWWEVFPAGTDSTGYSNFDDIGEYDYNQSPYGSYDDDAWFFLGECWLQAGESVLISLLFEDPPSGIYQCEGAFTPDTPTYTAAGGTAGVLALLELPQAPNYRLKVFGQAAGAFSELAVQDFDHPTGGAGEYQANVMLCGVGVNVAVLAMYSFEWSFSSGTPVRSRGYACVVRWDGSSIQMGDWVTVYDEAAVDGVSGLTAFYNVSSLGVGGANGHVALWWRTNRETLPAQQVYHDSVYRIDALTLVPTDEVTTISDRSIYHSRYDLGDGTFVDAGFGFDGTDVNQYGYRVNSIDSAGQLTYGTPFGVDDAIAQSATWLYPQLIPGTRMLMVTDLLFGGGVGYEAYDDQLLIGWRIVDLDTNVVGPVNFLSIGWYEWQNSPDFYDNVSLVNVGLGADGQPAVNFPRGVSGANYALERVTIPFSVGTDLSITFPDLDGPLSSAHANSPYRVGWRAPVDDDVYRAPSNTYIHRNGWSEQVASYQESTDSVLVYGTEFNVVYRGEYQPDSSRFDEIQTLYGSNAGPSAGSGYQIAWSDDITGPDGFTEYLWTFCQLYGAPATQTLALESSSVRMYWN